MKYQFINEAGTHVLRSDDVTIPWDVEAGGPLGGGPAWTQWEEDGSPQPDPYAPPPLTIDDYRNAVQALIDATAKERKYDNGLSFASYFNSTIAEWQAEARAFVAWRDAVWNFANEELAKVEGGKKPPSLKTFMSKLPIVEWPVI